MNLSSSSILHKIRNDIGFDSVSEMVAFASDFEDRPETLSSLLQSDFGLGALDSHRVRAILLNLVRLNNCDEEEKTAKTGVGDEKDKGSGDFMVNVNGETGNVMISKEKEATRDETQKQKQKQQQPKKKKKILFKDAIVNEVAKRRFESSTEKEDQKKKQRGYTYGLPKNYPTLYPKLATELDEFMTFMIKPEASSQDPPIRRATADVYMKHTKLFLGWFVTSQLKEAQQQQEEEADNASLSLHKIFPNTDSASTQPIVLYVTSFLTQTRQCSDSYQANVLRGMTKLLKFRYRHESNVDPTMNDGSIVTFQDIPAVREVRRLHRDANRRGGKGERSSLEEKKWLKWEEYLEVVKKLGEEVEMEIRDFEEKNNKKNNKTRRKKKKEEEDNQNETIRTSVRERGIATKYQAYLILAFFSCIPDRQRTVRELELGRTFVRTQPQDDNNNNNNENTAPQEPYWMVKHGPKDYKTGSTYGTRPPLILSSHLTHHIDDFVHRWRPHLLHSSSSSHDFLFAQPRTGNPLTRDSVYSIVARSCYRLTGKKTNPHLLRDMIVTHVKDSDSVCERDLEALALYMGHSVSMQRTSYDRRTLERKVAPAIDLLRMVNDDG